VKCTKAQVRTTPSGHAQFVSSYFFKGKDPKAKKAYLQSSIHGAELQGNAVIFHLIEFLKKNQPLGDVTLVPIANPGGMDRKTGEYTDGRFDPVTGDNFNRAYFVPDLDQFKSGSSLDQVKNQMMKAIDQKLKKNLRVAEKLALTLQRMAIQADVVLDLHNANVSEPYVYAASTAVNSALYFGFAHIISMPPEAFGGSLDEAILSPWAKLQKPLQFKDSELPEGYTLELGGQERISLSEAKQQADGILEFLKHKGVIRGHAKKPKACIVGDIADYTTIYAEAGGLYEYIHPTGKVAKKGTALATRLSFDSKGGYLTPIVAEQDFLPTLHYSSAAVGEGDELFRGFLKWRKVTA
jgi:predicted deacylase